MMWNKRVIGLLFLVLLSVSVVAAGDSFSECTGFLGSISCVLWGDPSVRSSLAGEAWNG